MPKNNKIKARNNGANLGFKEKPWQAANEIRGQLASSFRKYKEKAYYRNVACIQ